MMKKILLSFLLAVFCHFGYSYNIYIGDKEKVDIEEHPIEEPKKDRSIRNVECYLNRLDNTIEVEYSCIGKPDVYILDEYDNIVSYHPTNVISDKMIINIPNIEGYYMIVIESQSYCGRGIFQIF